MLIWIKELFPFCQKERYFKGVRNYRPVSLSIRLLVLFTPLSPVALIIKNINEIVIEVTSSLRATDHFAKLIIV